MRVYNHNEPSYPRKHRIMKRKVPNTWIQHMAWLSCFMQIFKTPVEFPIVFLLFEFSHCGSRASLFAPQVWARWWNDYSKQAVPSSLPCTAQESHKRETFHRGKCQQKGIWHRADVITLAIQHDISCNLYTYKALLIMLLYSIYCDISIYCRGPLPLQWICLLQFRPGLRCHCTGDPHRRCWKKSTLFHVLESLWVSYGSEETCWCSWDQFFLCIFDGTEFFPGSFPTSMQLHPFIFFTVVG